MLKKSPKSWEPHRRNSLQVQGPWTLRDLGHLTEQGDRHPGPSPWEGDRGAALATKHSQSITSSGHQSTNYFDKRIDWLDD